MLLKSFCCLILVLCQAVVWGREYVPDSTKGEPSLDSVMAKVDDRFSSRFNNDSMNKVWDAYSKEDTILRTANRNYHLFGLKHRQESLQWNLTSGIVIFWCVIVLVFSGISFAGIQFYKSLYQIKGSVDNPNLNLNTAMEANLKGFKISSPVLGVIILLISLMFFYLYLVYVYPITEIF
jgi:hypothetical protein